MPILTSPGPASEGGGDRDAGRVTAAVAVRDRLLAGLHGWLLRHAAELAEPVTLQGFRLHFHATPHPFYRNTAVPLADRADWTPALEHLCRYGRERGLRPRIECFAELFPRLERALERAAFRVELAPAMLAAARPHPREPEVRLPDRLTPPTAQAFLDAMLTAFGSPPPRRAEIQRLLRCHAAGRLCLAWRCRDGRIIAGAALGICGDTAELMGVFTAADCRGRGHARAVCGALASAFAAAGGRLLWLAARESASDLYARLGFRRIGTRLEAFAL